MFRCLSRNALIVFLFSCAGFPAFARFEKGYFKPVKNGAIYFSWGYNKEWYTRSTVEVNQPSLGNHYKLVNVKAHDNPGWDHQLFQKEITIPQYNYRLGYFFNKKQDLAIEINFDHTKYIIGEGQEMRLRGKLNDQQVDENITFSDANGFYYFLNNGANFLVVNLVKRFDIYHTKNRYFQIDLLTKAGAGPVIPHVENSLFGQPNEPGFQIGGWNAALETALRVTAFKYGYLEFAQKGVYARYSGLAVYEGKARQAFGAYELVLSLGFTIPTGKNNPKFKPEKSIEQLP